MENHTSMISDASIAICDNELFFSRNLLGSRTASTPSTVTSTLINPSDTSTAINDHVTALSTRHLIYWAQVLFTVSQSVIHPFISSITTFLPLQKFLPFVSLLILLLPFTAIVQTHAQHFNCNSGSCAQETLVCDQDNESIDCIVDCDGDVTCYNIIIHGGAGNVNVSCLGYYACGGATILGAKGNTFIDCHGEAACEYSRVNMDQPPLVLHSPQQNLIMNATGYWVLSHSKIQCFSTEYCNITATGRRVLDTAAIYGNVIDGTKLIINARGDEAMIANNIYCPTDHTRGPRYSDDALCNIYAGGVNATGMHSFTSTIHAVEALRNVNMTCEDTYSLILVCTQELTVTCALRCSKSGIDFVDPSCLCVDYLLPSMAPTVTPTMMPTTWAPSFAPTRYDPNEESPYILYVSNNGCDRGSCDSNTFYRDDHPCLETVESNQSSADCNENNTLRINSAEIFTHSVTANVYNETSLSTQFKVLCFDVNPSFTCYKPTVMEVTFENIYYYYINTYLNIGYKNTSNLLNNEECYGPFFHGDENASPQCHEFIDCPVRDAPLEDVWSTRGEPYAFYIINTPGVKSECYNPERSMNVRLSVKCGQSCGSFGYTFSCLRGEEVECTKYDGNSKITLDVGQYTFNDTIRISNKQIRIDGQGYSQTVLMHHVDNGSELINCHFRQ
eukprot:91223_1